MRNLGKRIDLHCHSLLSDGVLLPSELVRRAQTLDHKAIAITDHADASNLEAVVKSLTKVSNSLQKHLETVLIPGVELTHIPPNMMEGLASKARKLGAALIVVHGETIVEPVTPGTNRMAVNCSNVDILAHPGFISEAEAELAKENGVYLELSARIGHCLTNGHVAKTASTVKAKLLVNTDFHAPNEFLSQEAAFKLAIGSGLTEVEAVRAVRDNPLEILRRSISK